MVNAENSHQYQVGDAVLVEMGDAPIPGVITSVAGDQVTVELAQPWADEAGGGHDSVTVSPDKLQAYLEEETGGQSALPG